jgi:hypothetical protein
MVPALQPLQWRVMRTGELKRPGAILRVPAIHSDGSVILVGFVDGTLLSGRTAG